MTRPRPWRGRHCMRAVWSTWLALVALPPFVTRDIWRRWFYRGKVNPKHVCEEATLGSRRPWSCSICPCGWTRAESLWKQASPAPFIHTKGIVRVSLLTLRRFGMQKTAVYVNFSTPYEPPGPVCARPYHLYGGRRSK